MHVANRRIVFVLSSALGLLPWLAPSAGAQSGQPGPAYRESDIVEQFAPTAAPLTRGVRRGRLNRGLCVGTEADCPASEPAALQAAAPPPKPTFDLMVTFDYNSDDLTAEARQNLDEFAKALRNERLRGMSFAVEGHTDAKGSDAYNLALSERRAKAVVRYLVDQGIEGSRLAARGYGEAKPRVPDPLDASNRRVETRVNTVGQAAR
ncbi:MAG TPA: OmpA family protein [Microvirga sp.]|jgi:outer membrane protein OmpA-like peptidoglycan-associated protein|nr:OmpA family protein [Microvirga sp.]